jgi:hypothetical protein
VAARWVRAAAAVEGMEDCVVRAVAHALGRRMEEGSRSDTNVPLSMLYISAG